MASGSPFTPRMVYVEVTFDASNLADPITSNFFGETNPQPLQIEVDQGLAIITFELNTIGNGNTPPASFQTFPIQWVEGPNPVPIPLMFMLQPADSTHVTVLDFNTQPGPSARNHVCWLQVVYNSNFYSGDPTIVNQPPTT